MIMNLRNIERILDVLQYGVEHFGQTFMEEDIYAACPKATKNIIDMLDEREVFTCTNDGINFDERNIEDYRSLLSDLQDDIENLDIPEDEKKEFASRLELHLNMNYNLLNLGL